MTVRIPEPPVPKIWLLDANVLFSEWSVLFCANLAARYKAEVVYTPHIEDEAFRNLVRLGRLSEVDAKRLRALYPEVIPATLLGSDPSGYLADVRFVQEKDRPIAAAALQHSVATHQPVALITWNIRDFPRKPLLKKQVVRYTPDDLAVRLIETMGYRPQELVLETKTRLGDFQTLHPHLQATSFQERARPWPVSAQEWTEFLKRNRLLRLNSLIVSELQNYIA